MSYRRSYNDLAYGDDDGAGGRWDRDRFERVRARSRGPPPRSSLRVEEDERVGPRGSRLDVEVDSRSRSARPPPRPRSAVYEERDRYFEEDSYGPRRPRPDFYEEDRYRSEGKELAPYSDRYRDPPQPPRKISERIVPRYDDDGRGNNENVKIDLRIGNDERRDRRAERRGGGDDFHEDIRIDDRRDGRREEIHIDERFDDRRAPVRRYYDEPPRAYRPPPPPIEPDWRDYEDYRDAKIIRERTIDRRAPSRTYGEEELEEEKIEVKEDHKRPAGTKKGRTRMPKRLVHKRAIIEMGYPFEEEEDFYIVRLALAKDHIDECIKISERYKEEEKITYNYSETKTETKAIEAPPPPPPQESETEVTETVTRRIIENPTADELEDLRHAGEDDEHHSHADGEFEHASAHGRETGSLRDEAGSEHGSNHTARTHRTHRTAAHDSPERESHHSRRRSKSVHASARSKSRRRSEFRSKSRRRTSRYEDDEEEESGTVTGPLGLIISPSRGDRDRDRSRRRDRDIKAEIRELEEEKRRLRGEIHDDGDEVRVEKDRRGRLNLVRSSRD